MAYVDADGDVDVVTGSREVAWHDNDGSGVFTRRVIEPETFPDYVGAADVDSDGDPDLLVAGRLDLHWFENDGFGMFRRHRIVAGRGVRWAAAADVDGDGQTDVLWSLWDTVGSRALRWSRNHGDGSWGLRNTTPISDLRSIRSVHTADLDGDDDIDVVVAAGETLAWYENDGTGSFTEHSLAAGETARSAYPVDLDGDSHMDLVFALGTTFGWYRNDGTGSFTQRRVIALSVDEPPTTAYAFDLDGDGDADPVWADADRINWHSNDGSGAFSTRMTIAESIGSIPQLRAADLDEDGMLDLLAVHSLDKYGNSKASWFKSATSPIRAPLGVEAVRLEDGIGVQWTPLSTVAAGGAAVTRYVATAKPRSGSGEAAECETDGNGSHCVVPAVTDAAYSVTVRAENAIGTGPASRPVVVPAAKTLDAVTGDTPWRLGDFNGDGRDDVVIRHDDGRWAIQSLDGSLDGSIAVTRNPDWRLVAIGDLNGDGKDDLLLRHTQGHWSYYPMDGDRVIDAGRGWARLTGDTRWTFAGMGDLNGDGRDDVLLRHVDGQWRYEPMNGRNPMESGRGWAGLNRSLGWQLAGMGDFNGDGRDAVLMRHTNGLWHYYAMQGRRVVTRQSGPVALTSDLAWRLAGIGDFDGDGRDDVLLRHVDGAWRLYAMDGREPRRAAPTGLEGDQAWRAAGIGDLDGDGTDDVLLRDEDGRWRVRAMRSGRAVPVRRGVANLPADVAWSLPGRTARYPHRATLAGTLTGADVTVSALSETPVVVHRTRTDGRGRFGVPATALRDPDLLYGVVVSGGYDEGGATGGTLRALATRDQLVRGLNVGVLSDIGWRYTRLKRGRFGAADDLTRLSDVARALLERDVSGDRVIDHADLAAFDPATDAGALAFDYGHLADRGRFEDGLSVLDTYRAADPEAEDPVDAKLDAVLGTRLNRHYAEDSRGRSVTVTLVPFGDGSVRSADGRIVADPFPPNRLERVYPKDGGDLVFQATPGQGSRVLSWVGCDETSPDLTSCTVSLDRDRVVEVSFGHEQASIVDSFADLTGAAETRDEGDGRLTLVIADRDDELLATVQNLKDGDYIVGDGIGPRMVESQRAGSGFVAARKTGYRQYEIATSAATLEDIIEEGTVYFNRTVTEGDLTNPAATSLGPASLPRPLPADPPPAGTTAQPFSSSHPGVSLIPSGDPTNTRLVIELGSGAVTGGVPDCEIEPIGQLAGSCAVTVRDGAGNPIARVRGRIELEISIEFGASWGLPPKGLESVKVVPEIRATQDLDVEMLVAGVQATREFHLAIVRPAHITFVVGVVPVYLAPVIEITAGVDAKVGVTVRTGIEATQTLRAGFVYQRGQDVSFSRHFNPAWKFEAPEIRDPEVGLGGSIRPFLEFTGSVFLYGVVGPGVTVKPSIVVSGGVSTAVGSSCLEKDAGARLALEAYLALETEPNVDKLLGRLVKENVALDNVRLSLYKREWPLWDWEKTTCAGRPRIVLEGTDVAETVRRASEDDSKWGVVYRIRNKGQGDLRWDVVEEDEHGLLDVRKPGWSGRLLAPEESHDLAVHVDARSVPTGSKRIATFRVVDAQRRDAPDVETGAAARSISVQVLPPHLEAPTNLAARLAADGTEVRLEWNHGACLVHQLVPGTDTYVEGFRVLRSARDRDLDDPAAWVDIGYVPAASACEAVFPVCESYRVGGACGGVRWQKGETYHLRVAAVDGHSVAPSIGYETLTVDWNQVPTFRGATFAATVEFDKEFSFVLPRAYGGDGDLAYKLQRDPYDTFDDDVEFDSRTRRLYGSLPWCCPGSRVTYVPAYTAEDRDGDTASMRLSIRVVEAAEDLSFTGSVSNQTYEVNETITPLNLPAATGGRGKLAYTLEPKVPGLDFDDANRRLSGRPTTVGTYAMTYRVTDEDGEADERRFTITVRRQPPPDSRPLLPAIDDMTFTLAERVSVTLPEASGGDDPKKYTLSPRPTGLSFNGATRELFGTPSEARTWRSVRYEVEDRDGDSHYREFAITVEPDEDPPRTDGWITGEWDLANTYTGCATAGETDVSIDYADEIYHVSYRGRFIRDIRVDDDTGEVTCGLSDEIEHASDESGYPEPSRISQDDFLRWLHCDEEREQWPRCADFYVTDFSPDKITVHLDDPGRDSHRLTYTYTPKRGTGGDRGTNRGRRGIPLFR
ncbi:MAG: FG-GAP-like repeat-containing protein [Gammaproteobacteria bacterium]|nr:FG-GAP-like repeat-containing protein [Gammaproteobacteria bacterium]